MKNLSNIRVGEKVIVSKVLGKGALRRRMMDMGITRGAEIYIKKAAPLGDPIEINVRNYDLSLRKEDAAMISVEESVENEG